MGQIVDFRNTGYTVLMKRYSNNNRLAILLVNPEEPQYDVIVCTINMPSLELNDNIVIIKNYSENEGVLDALIKHEVISEPIGVVQTGFVKSPMCKVLIDT